MENYLNQQRDHIFRNVEVLIYVFDVENRETEKELHYYQSVVEAIAQHSNQAKVFCLIHKMDLVPEEQRDGIFQDRQLELRKRGGPLEVQCFQTSIWDETLYKAWSSIVYSLIPNVKTLESNLQSFCEIAGADEVVLFERATFLVISYASRLTHSDPHRFEKISNIIKQFKLSCSKSQANFSAMQVKSGKVSAFLDILTSNTYLMVIVSDPLIRMYFKFVLIFLQNRLQP